MRRFAPFPQRGMRQDFITVLVYFEGESLMRRLGPATSFLAGLVLLASPIRAELITNGTFSGSASGWTLAALLCPLATAYDPLAGNPAGSARLNTCGESNGDSVASQLVTGLSAGLTYTLTWDVLLHFAGTFAGNGESFGVFLDNQPGSPIFLGEWLDDNWHAAQVSFVATNSSHTIYLASELDLRTPGVAFNTDVSYYIDNVSLTQTGSPIPEPAMGYMVAVGLVIFRVSRQRLGRH